MTETQLRPQSRKASLVEAVSNTVIGLIIAYFMNILLYTAYHVQVQGGTVFAITMWMTLVSIVRSFILRRLWNSEWWKHWKGLHGLKR